MVRECPHSLWEKDGALADGRCPLCMAAALEELRMQNKELWQALEPFARHSDAKSLAEALGHIMREDLEIAARVIKTTERE